MKAAWNLLGCIAALAAALGPAPAHANPVVFQGADVGAGPGTPHPNTDAATAAFESAAAALGPAYDITFQGLAPGQPSADYVPLAVGNGASLSLQGADHNRLAPGYNFGITSAPANALYGYSMTPGNANYFEFAPRLGVGTASVTFTLAAPTPFFGLDLTGLGTANGDLHVVFNDSVARDIPIAGSPQGGAQFFGFIDAGAKISTISLQLQDVTGPSRDLFGIDDIRIINAASRSVVPEPPAATLAALGGLVLLACRRLRPGRDRARSEPEGPAMGRGPAGG